MFWATDYDRQAHRQNGQNLQPAPHSRQFAHCALKPACSYGTVAGSEQNNYNTMNKIPNYALYGETAQPVWHEALHVEQISQRSGAHNWEIAAHRHEGLLQLLYLQSGGGEVLFDSASMIDCLDELADRVSKNKKRPVRLDSKCMGSYDKH